ncbi:isocitrate lyase/PEP mutase family protein [Dinghuibacter silviterrae]|uniref:2-methylisocitrate lyase-like PEP mutase family enzyme n=1 Tax=Dinghuibacter silviterrae TaxID=1539049 RepID=A0A4R8DSJ0_9BACT|nr:isocitrate lyase/phosphoenolpyruvate mutase family protein [Dinghuibacter silviterrae]TDX01019.1 2-methylisocitrate lyase-like PEP mutase family enzyme [Dinghuibacter silviterrae]
MNLAQRFRSLHFGAPLLFLPNIWDVAGARLLEELGYPAVATASAAVSRSLGYEDGEKIPFDQLCWLLERIASSVKIPVTADIESGFAPDPEGLQRNIRRVIDTGVVGINFEDTDVRTGQLIPLETQVTRISAVREAAGEKLYINARVDSFLRLKTDQREDALRRAAAYLEAGADGIYPIGVRDMGVIKTLVEGIPAPINIGGVLDLKALEALGVARVSTGPGFHQKTLEAMRALAGSWKA